jgi:hypothetical protein
MASSPYTPSRPALGDISNHKKFLKSTLKTPLRVVPESSNPIELISGETMRPILEEGIIFQQDYSNDTLTEYPDYFLPSVEIIPEDSKWEDAGFLPIESEILKYLDLEDLSPK